jgi:hypothetical protein
MASSFDIEYRSLNAPATPCIQCIACGWSPRTKRRLFYLDCTLFYSIVVLASWIAYSNANPSVPLKRGAAKILEPPFYSLFNFTFPAFICKARLDPRGDPHEVQIILEYIPNIFQGHLHACVNSDCEWSFVRSAVFPLSPHRKSEAVS